MPLPPPAPAPWTSPALPQAGVGVRRWLGLAWLVWGVLAFGATPALAAPRGGATRQDTLKGDTEGSPPDRVLWLAKRRQVAIAGVPYGITGLPVVYYSPRTGWNYGARLQWADYRRRPYRYKVVLNTVRST